MMEPSKQRSEETLLADLRSFVRAETLSKKLKKLPHGFYGDLRELISRMEKERTVAVNSHDYERFAELAHQIETIRGDFRQLIHKRMEKIGVFALYGKENESLSTIVGEERAYVMELVELASKHKGLLLDEQGSNSTVAD